MAMDELELLDAYESQIRRDLHWARLDLTAEVENLIGSYPRTALACGVVTGAVAGLLVSRTPPQPRPERPCSRSRMVRRAIDTTARAALSTMTMNLL